MAKPKTKSDPYHFRIDADLIPELERQATLLGLSPTQWMANRLQLSLRKSAEAHEASQKEAGR